MSRSARRKGREAALQLLYQVELTGGDLSDATLELFWEQHPSDAAREEGTSSRVFAEQLVREALRDRGHIDALIDDATRNWDLDRISRVDLSLLRLAVVEILTMPETPAAVVINEAVEIARRFFDEKAASFINAVVDRIAREHGRHEEGRHEEAGRQDVLHEDGVVDDEPQHPTDQRPPGAIHKASKVQRN